MLRYGVTCIACVVLVLLALREDEPGRSPAAPAPVELATPSRAPAVVQPRSARAREREVARLRSSRRPRTTPRTRRSPVRHAAAPLTAARGDSLPGPAVRERSPGAGDGEPGSSRTVGSRPRRPGGGEHPHAGGPLAPADVPAAKPAPAPVSVPPGTPADEVEEIEPSDDDDPAELAEEAEDLD